MYRLIWTPEFTRSAERFIRQHPELKKRLAKILIDLEADPFQPHLRYHHLSGKLKGVQAVRVTESYRITLTVVISEQHVILLDIGSHDEVYR